MEAGKLDRLITIERASESRGRLNSVIQKWLPVARVYASKQDVRDAERVASQEVGAEITTRFQIFWSSEVADVSPKDRIVLDGRPYDISGVKEIGTREGLELTATARADS